MWWRTSPAAGAPISINVDIGATACRRALRAVCPRTNEAPCNKQAAGTRSQTIPAVNETRATRLIAAECTKRWASERKASASRVSSLACSHYGKHVATPSRQLTGLTALRPHAQCFFSSMARCPCSATQCVCSSGTCHSAHQHDTLSKWNTMHRHTCYVRRRSSAQRRAHNCR